MLVDNSTSSTTTKLSEDVQDMSLSPASPPYITRPPNPWILFRSATREEAKAFLQEKGSSVREADVSREVRNRWQCADRGYWYAQAKAAKEAHDRKYPHYKYHPGSKKKLREQTRTKRKSRIVEQATKKQASSPPTQRRKHATDASLGSNAIPLNSTPSYASTMQPSVVRLSSPFRPSFGGHAERVYSPFLCDEVSDLFRLLSYEDSRPLSLGMRHSFTADNSKEQAIDPRLIHSP
ncbi:hypothetical protein BDW22DRAFT_1429479 [Trametopsis cervina]|nr:hypothetical protein BDW22DRAFT_1429479 [Trametopsis cervina]